MTFFSLPAGAATFAVTNLNDSGAGSLRQAILDANNAAGDDTIAFQSGLSGTILLSSQIVLGSSSGSLTINGPGASVLAISGNNATRIFTIGSNVTINNLTLKNGRSSTGGAIYGGGTITINQCVLSNNVSTGTGGAIDNLGTMTIANSILSGNSAKSSGGAIFNRNAANKKGLTVINSTLSGNSATVTTANTGGGNGGGIYSGNSTELTIVNSTLSGNSATNTDSGGRGGGIYFTGSRLTITNSTLSGNSASALTCPTSQCSRGLGGGLHATWGTANDSMSVLDSTFTGNAAANVGGGIYLSGGTLTVGNNIVSGNNAPNGKEAAANNPASSSARFTSLGHNLFGENGADGLVNITRVASDRVLPGAIGTALGSLADNGGPTQTHLPVPGSPAIDAGDNALIPQGLTTDQRGAGFPRLFGGTVDIGAVEVSVVTLFQTVAGTISWFYAAAFDRTPIPNSVLPYYGDIEGLAFWTRTYLAGEGALAPYRSKVYAIADFFVGSAEFQARYPAALTAEEFVTALYQNMLGRAPDPGGLGFWVGRLANGASRGTVLADFTNSDENRNANPLRKAALESYIAFIDADEDNSITPEEAAVWSATHPDLDGAIVDGY